MSLSGPRVGMTFLTPASSIRSKEDFNKDIDPVISQFGWQYEKRFLSSDTGATGVTEWVVLLGGIDQGVVIPSLTGWSACEQWAALSLPRVRIFHLRGRASPLPPA